MKDKRKILMLGWEFPPKISGGLGVASQGLAESLVKSGHDITFLLPKKSKKQVSQHVKLVDASTLKPDLDFWKEKKVATEIWHEIEIGTRLLPYLPPETFQIAHEKQKVVESLEATQESELLEHLPLTGSYEADLGAELIKYALLSVQVARKQKPDLVHAHDWITFRAGTMIKKILKKPLFLHVHSTEYDRNSIHAQPFVVEEEQRGFDAADHIFCVSEKLKVTICSQYGIDEKRVTVAPNAINQASAESSSKRKPKTLAFVGRLTAQKSPSTFIDIARDLTSRGHNFQYLVIGDGYLRGALEGRVKSSNFSNLITFTGFLERTDLMKKLGEIDLLVMPSASEPFGLVALEAIMKKIPVAAASGSGVGEFIPSMPHVDRWDHYSYIRLIEQLMTDSDYRESVVEKCYSEASKLTWDKTAEVVEKLYRKVLR